MICRYCNGTGTSNTCVNGTFKPCAACNGTGEEIKEKITNFDSVTASPEALTIFIEDIMMPCYGCNVKSIKNCPHKKKIGVRFCDRKECFKWLNEECKE